MYVYVCVQTFVFVKKKVHCAHTLKQRTQKHTIKYHGTFYLFILFKKKNNTPRPFFFGEIIIFARRYAFVVGGDMNDGAKLIFIFILFILKKKGQLFYLNFCFCFSHQKSNSLVLG